MGNPTYAVPDISPTIVDDDDVPTFAGMPGPWFVALTKSNQETRLAWWLLNQGVPYFLPRLCRDKPLLKGIVFVGSTDRWSDPDYPGHPGPTMTTEVKRSNVVYGFLFTSHQSRFQQEIALLATHKIKTLASAKSTDVKLGREVKFLAPHCLDGLSGHVVGLTNHHQQIVKVAVELQLLGQMVSVEVDPDQVGFV